MVPAHGYYRLSPTIQIHLPHGRTVFIKQAPFSTHRTPYQAFGARHPSSVTPLTGRASFPPGEAKGASANSPWCIPIGILRTAPDPSGAMRRLPFQGRLNSAPRWGSCRALARLRGCGSLNGSSSKIPTAPPLPLCGTSPKGGSKGLCEFALVHSDWYSAYRKPLRHAYARPSSPFRGGFYLTLKWPSAESCQV